MRPNRATHATLPLPGDSDDRTRCAIAAYRAYVAEPIWEPPPTLAEVWLITADRAEYINSPMFTYPADELADLRRRVEQIRCVRDLADWLWDCRAIGVEPL